MDVPRLFNTAPPQILANFEEATGAALPQLRSRNYSLPSVFVRVNSCDFVDRLFSTRRRNDPRASHELTRTKRRAQLSFKRSVQLGN